MSRLPLVIAFAAAIALAVGATGPWIENDITGTLSGTSDGRDGVLLMVVVAMLGVTLVFRAVKAHLAQVILVGLFSLVSLGTSIADIIDVNTKSTEMLELTVGWGLWLCLGASVVLCLATIGLAMTTKSEPKPAEFDVQAVLN